jgi:hypothetical protein
VRQVDLHGMKTAEAIDCFTRAYDSVLGSCARSGAGARAIFGAHHDSGCGSGSGACLKVIHGYGSGGARGDTRRAIRSLLHANPACADYVPGEDIDGNPGYTIVYPRRRLPSGASRLYPGIVEYCSAPKTKLEVVRRFVRRSAESDIDRALRELENSGRLRSFIKNGRKHYVDPRAL